MYVCDLVNPETGKTWRQENAEMTHNIEIGTLVEIKDTGARLFVALQNRDCDMTPLYWLSPYRDDLEQKTPGFANRKWIGGYPEDALEAIK